MTRAGRHGLALAVAVLLAACANTPPADPFAAAGRAWPEPPAAARIGFVTGFHAPADLGIRPTFWRRAAALATGARDDGMILPMAVAATADGQVVYVADPGAHGLHRYDLRRGRYNCLQPESGAGLVAPVALAMDAAGRVYLSDSAAGVVYVAAPGATALSALDLAPPPVQPTGLAALPDGGLAVVDTHEHHIRQYDADGRLLRDVGARGAAPGRLNYPTGLWLDPPADLLVADTLNFRIQRLGPDGHVRELFGRPGDGSGGFGRPKGVAADRAGHVWVTDGMHNAVHLFDRSGRLLLALGEVGTGPGQFWLPNGIFVTPAGLVFVADTYNRRVQVFRLLGEPS